MEHLNVRFRNHTWCSKCFLFLKQGDVFNTFLLGSHVARAILHDNRDEMFLPDPELRRFRAGVQQFLREYAVLASEADAAQLKLFSVVPKLHYYWHLQHRAQFLNPRKGCTFIDEDYVGKIKDLVQSSASGSPSHLIPLAVADKFRWGKHVLIEYPHLV